MYNLFCEIDIKVSFSKQFNDVIAIIRCNFLRSGFLTLTNLSYSEDVIYFTL